jgi:site-specific recombinase XerD
VPACIWKLCERLARRPHARGDCVFLNEHGRPYSKDRLVKLMERLRRRAQIPSAAGEQLVLYSHRHTFGTEATGRVTDLELAELMGHTTTQTTRRYVHLNAERLREIRRRVDAARKAPESV